MPGISDKGQRMPASPIRKLVPFAEKALKAGRKVHHLNIGQPDIHTPEVVLEKMRNLDLKVVEYSHSAGFSTYREGLANYYNSVGIGLDASEIIITTGGSEALLMGMLSCLNPGDEVIIPEPFYANYNGFAVAVGVNVVPIPTSIESGFALPPIEAFEARITDRTKAILICNPGNPTGVLYRNEELETLRNLVLQHDLFLFADEVYREFCYDGLDHHSIMNLEGLEQHAILAESVSKRYSMCGARVCAIASHNREVMDTVLKFAQARLSPPTFGQIAGEAALETPTSYFEEVIEEYVERRDTLVDGLNQIEGVVCPKPTGAFYAMAELPVDSSEKFCQWILESFELNNTTVMMAPASGFYSDPEQGKRQVRLAYVLEKAFLQEAVAILDAALKAYPGRHVATSSEVAAH